MPPGSDPTWVPARSASPTPSQEKLKPIWTCSFWIRAEWIGYYLVFALVLVLSALISAFHPRILDALGPITDRVHITRFGWLFPIPVLFVLSFPPLFGHELVAIVCGSIWGLWPGFSIVAVGTLLGEMANFWGFSTFCRTRSEKCQRNNVHYACFVRVVRDSGLKIAFIARLGAIPPHFTTAAFSTAGMSFPQFTLAALLAMPKQLIPVYLGVLLKAQHTRGLVKSPLISAAVLTISILITTGTFWCIVRLMRKVRPEIIDEQDQAREKMESHELGT
ncbi:hypothetical protein C8J56DRAFT_367110 [Mycena floridula]|nr:hypothetical protein C8J56DRAFT_367110 [Mycena floridula]